MGRRYIYTVVDRKTGEKVVEGTLFDCEDATGIHRNTIRESAICARFKYNTYTRRKYHITRRHSDDMPTKSSNYYSIYSKKNDELLACGTSDECAKAMGWSSRGILYQAISRERRDGSTPYEFYSESYYENLEEDMI